MKKLYIKLWALSLFAIGFTQAQTVTTLAGSITQGSADGTGASASFYYTTGVAADGAGNLYVADAGNNEIRKIVISTGVVTTLAGSTTAGSNDGTGSSASFSGPTGVVADGSGNLYVADFGNNEIRKIVISTGVVTTLAGSITSGSANGTGTSAKFYNPFGICMGGSDTLFVADGYNNEIRMIIISTATVSTLAGSTASGSTDGTGPAARFYLPYGVVADGIGNLYVVDAENNEIRKIVISTGVVTTIAGSTTPGSTDGTGLAARFNFPFNITIDKGGNLYVTDANNNEIRKIVISTAAVTTFAGSTTNGSNDGTGPLARFFFPIGICIDGGGTLYVGDHNNNDIRKITTPPLGINPINPFQEYFSVYPNPSNGKFTIQSSVVSQQSSVEVYNLFGQQVYSQLSSPNSKFSIDLGSQPSGIYLYRVISEEGELIGTGKLVIQ